MPRRNTRTTRVGIGEARSFRHGRGRGRGLELRRGGERGNEQRPQGPGEDRAQTRSPPPAQPTASKGSNGPPASGEREGGLGLGAADSVAGASVLRQVQQLEPRRRRCLCRVWARRGGGSGGGRARTGGGAGGSGDARELRVHAAAAADDVADPAADRSGRRKTGRGYLRRRPRSLGPRPPVPPTEGRGGGARECGGWSDRVAARGWSEAGNARERGRQIRRREEARPANPAGGVEEGGSGRDRRGGGVTCCWEG
ncbi:hypothetical protein SETIT_5G354100v2 [Setaria italica]|uniref:Uncharacterized protein n=1 Tax=Setaria italica TaxID=4555 RepID=A0A368RC91_SETIT|nr:hypothetical protein SETIT_5G354100v2 [Setaria italica]